MEGQSNKLNPEITLRIKEIFNQSLYLENRINEILSDIEPEKETYDILIVEDDNATIMVLTDFFELKGYSSKGVTTGEKAINELNRYTPKMILMDIVLPDIDGFEISKMIRFDEKFKKLSGVPVYFITAIPETVISSKISESGAEGFLLKPFDFEKLNILFSDL
jgi:DNA-binding response OmpR family regulator